MIDSSRTRHNRRYNTGVIQQASNIADNKIRNQFNKFHESVDSISIRLEEVTNYSVTDISNHYQASRE